jgi:hypothetical protein
MDQKVQTLRVTMMTKIDFKRKLQVLMRSTFYVNASFYKHMEARVQ